MRHKSVCLEKHSKDYYSVTTELKNGDRASSSTGSKDVAVLYMIDTLYKDKEDIDIYRLHQIDLDMLASMLKDSILQVLDVKNHLFRTVYKQDTEQ